MPDQTWTLQIRSCQTTRLVKNMLCRKLDQVAYGLAWSPVGSGKTSPVNEATATTKRQQRVHVRRKNKRIKLGTGSSRNQPSFGAHHGVEKPLRLRVSEVSDGEASDGLHRFIELVG